MKKVLSIVLAIVMTLSMITPVFAASYTDTKANDYEAAIEHLSGLGVIEGYEDGTYLPEKVVTRAEMAKLLVVCLGLESGADILKNVTFFNDVPTSHWANGFIGVASQYGLIKGDGDGNFRPDDTVSYAEAATMCLRALGYERVIEKAGQWPTNYLNKGNELKIFEDIAEFSGTDGAKRGPVAQLMWNMINTQMWVVDSENETDGVNYKKGDTMLLLKFPDFTRKVRNELTGIDDVVVNYMDGIVNFNDLMIIDKDTIRFNGVEFDNVSPIKFIDALEYELLYTIAKDGTKEGKSLVLKTISDSGIDEIYSTVFGKVEDVTSKKITVNGKDYTFDDENSDYEDIFGLVVLFLDKNGKVEYVEELYNYIGEDVIKEVSTEDDVTSIELYIGGDAEIEEDKDIYTLSYDEEDFDIILTTFDGKILDISDLSEKDVISIFQYNDYFTFVVVSDGSISGEFDKLVDNRIVIDGTKYAWNSNSKIKYASEKNDEDIDLAKVKGQIGEEVTAYVTLNNHIILLEAEDEIIADNYGYIIQEYQYVNSDGDTALKYKVMDLNGETKTYDVCDDDGEAYIEDDGKSYSENNVNKFIKFELLDGKINNDTIANNLALINNDEVFVNEIISNLNDTRKIIKTGVDDNAKEFIVTSSTKFVKAKVDEDTEKLSLTTFKYADLDEGDTIKYIITEADDSNKIAYVVIEADLASDEANIGIIMSDEEEYADDVIKVSFYDVATGETNLVEILDSNDREKDIAIGTVVKYTVNTSDKYTFETEDLATINKNSDDETTESAGDGYLSIVGTNIVITEDAKVIFVDTDNKVSEKSLSSLKDGYEVIGAVENEDSADDDKIYDSIVVVKVVE